jgi:RHS repeat-associated protein
VSLPGGATLSYLYDADGRRVRQTAGGQVTNYQWDETALYGDMVREYDTTGATIASYVFANTNLLSTQRGGVRSYYLLDTQGSVRAISTAAAELSDQYNYTAFGETRIQTGSSVQLYGYTGQQGDAETGLYYLRARYYAPGMGRFLSRDPAALNPKDPREWNRYPYVANDPINFIDPSGEAAGVEYGKIRTTFANATQTATVFGHRVGATIAAAKGAFDALDARLISVQVRMELLRYYSSRYVSSIMRNITVAQTTVITEAGETKVVVAINGANRSQQATNAIMQIVQSLRAKGVDAFIADGDLHAEQAAYQRALTYTKDFISIGISNSRGPCGPERQDCAAFFENLKITVFYLGRFVTTRSGSWDFPE